MDRRGFLGSILALAVAPAIVRVDSLMRIVPRETSVWTIESTPGGIWYSGEIGSYEGVRFIESLEPGAILTPSGKVLPLDFVSDLARLMRKSHIPPGPDGNYVAVIHPSFARVLRAEISPLARYDGFRRGRSR